MLAATSYAFACYNYTPARIYTPLAIMGILWSFKTKILIKPYPKIRLLVFLGTFLLLLTPLITLLTQNSETLARAEYLNIFQTQYLDQSYGYRWLKAHTSKDSLELLSENNLRLRITCALIHYLAHYSPQYLFFSGGSNLRFGTPEFGIFTAASLLGLLIGVVSLIKTKDPLKRALLYSFLLYGIPSALTWEDIPHSGRGIIAHPALDIIIALGWWKIFQTIKSNPRLSTPLKTLLVGAALIWNTHEGTKYLHYQTTEHNKKAAGYMQAGYKEMMKYIKKTHQDYENIFIVQTGLHYQSEIFALVYSNTACQDYLDTKKIPWNIRVLYHPPEHINPNSLYIYAPPDPAENRPDLQEVAAFYWPKSKDRAFSAYIKKKN